MPAKRNRRPALAYCDCLAVLRRDGSCPRCDHGKLVVRTFCRRCLQVHRSIDICREWTPPCEP